MNERTRIPTEIQTFCERIRIVDVVFEPEAISELEVVKLPGEDTRERGSKKCSSDRVF